MRASTFSIVGIFILICIMAAIFSTAVMQVVKAEIEIGKAIYVLGGAVFLVASVVPIMLIIMIRMWAKSISGGKSE